MPMVSSSNVHYRWMTSNRKHMSTVILSPNFAIPLLLLWFRQIWTSTSIALLPKKNLPGYSTQMICIVCTYPTYLLMYLNPPPSPALVISKRFLVTKHLLLRVLLIILFQKGFTGSADCSGCPWALSGVLSSILNNIIWSYFKEIRREN